MQSGKQDTEPSENAPESKALQKLSLEYLEVPSTGNLRFCNQDCKTKAEQQSTDVGATPTTVDMSAQPQISNGCSTEEQSGKEHGDGIISSLDTVADVPTTLCRGETNVPCVPNFSKQASRINGQSAFKRMTLVSEDGSTNGDTSMTRDRLQPLKSGTQGSEHVKEHRSLMRDFCLCPLTGCIMKDPVTAQVSPRDSSKCTCHTLLCFALKDVLTWTEDMLDTLPTRLMAALHIYGMMYQGSIACTLYYLYLTETETEAEMVGKEGIKRGRVQDGVTYERAAISDWFHKSMRSPTTSQTLNSQDLQPNLLARQVIMGLSI